jgi:hypothetical protein
MKFYPVTLRRYEPDSSTPTPHHAVAAFAEGGDRVYLNRNASSSADSAAGAVQKARTAFAEGKFTLENSENWTSFPLGYVDLPA